MVGNRFRNWQNAVDIDYLSLYIKTWFAFLSTVQELHPEAINGTGDGSLISIYKDSVGIPLKFVDVMKPHIEKVYTLGSQVIYNDVPTSYYVNFFRTNSSYVLDNESLLSTYKTIDGERVYDKSFIKIEYKDKMNSISNPNLLITVKSSSEKFHLNLNCYHVCLNIELSSFIDNLNTQNNNRIFRTKDDCIDLIEKKLKEKFYLLIEQIGVLGIDEKEERKGYCNGLLATLINLLHQNFSNADLFVHLPFVGFPEDYDVDGNKKKIINWFISFNYQIRNLLFHSIIDPFNSEWLRLFKHAYLALKELVEYNIEKIEQQNISVEIE